VVGIGAVEKLIGGRATGWAVAALATLPSAAAAALSALATAAAPLTALSTAAALITLAVLRGRALLSATAATASTAARWRRCEEQTAGDQCSERRNE
jgi:hypothetical protein